MPRKNFIVPCSRTGLNVQVAVDEGESGENLFLPITCPACRGVHLVSPRTGRLPYPARRKPAGVP